MQTEPISTNGIVVKTSVNTRGKNKKTLAVLLVTIALVVTISVVYIIIYPTL